MLLPTQVQCSKGADTSHEGVYGVYLSGTALEVVCELVDVAKHGDARICEPRPPRHLRQAQSSPQ